MNNILIAKFLGVKIDDQGMTGYDFDDLEYHCSWDWLMPVVEKIESLDIYFGISSKNITVFPIDNLNANKPIVKIMGWIEKLTKIEATHKAVVEFIKWYNENK